MQNKANSQRGQMNVKSFRATDYDDSCRFQPGKNKANSKPNKANLVKTQMTALKARLTEYDYAKQSQFPKSPNEHKLLVHKGI